MKQKALIALFAAAALFPSELSALTQDSPPHLDKRKLPYGCGSCHVGFNFKSGGGMTGCTVCHGDPNKVIKGLMASGIELKNIETEFKKVYRHPTFDARGIHSPKEILPEIDPKAPRHADCVDCHDPHQVSRDNKYAGIKGRRAGNVPTAITKESELCYLCHGDSANLPGRSTNKRQLFATNNPSFHPVEGEGKNSAVISLIKPYTEKKISSDDVSTITCTDCHRSDNPDSPPGPHGSANQYILVEHYSARDKETESGHAYALCYRCHSRSSILGDESFKYHSQHIRGRGDSAISTGTSCHTCHDSHGSVENKYLIKFNPEVVSSNSAGVLKFVSKGSGTFRGECFLSCHGVEHSPKSY